MTRKANPQKVKENPAIAGFTDHNGFHPVRSGITPKGAYLPGYDPDLAGDNDDVFDKEIRRERNMKKAQELDEKRQYEAALEGAIGEERKLSLSEFVRKSGGIKFDEKTTDKAERGELRRLSFKQSGKRGIAHPKGKNTLDGMREAADLAGYHGKTGEPMRSTNDFLDAIEADLKGRKIYPFGGLTSYKSNPASSQAIWKKRADHLKRVARLLEKRGIKAQAGRLRKAQEIADRNAKAAAKKPTPRTGAKPKKNPSTPKLKENGLIETMATIAVGTGAAWGVWDRIRGKKPTPADATGAANDVLKENKASNPAYHEARFEQLLEDIENGDFKKVQNAKLQGKLAGYGDGEIRHLVGSAQLTGGWRKYSEAKNKKNPSAQLVKQTDEFLLKENGVVGRAWARHKATNAYRRQLKLEAALDRAKNKRSGYERKARKNPVTSKAFEEFHGRKPTQVLQLEVPEGAPRNPWTIGRLLEIRLKRIPGETPADFPRVLDFRKETTGNDFYLVAAESKRQMWIAGKKIKIYAPNSEIKKGNSIDCAEITHVIYEAEKHHLGDVAPQGYIHKLGREGHLYRFREDRGLPALAFDRDGCAIIRGGVYTITPLGIAD